MIGMALVPQVFLVALLTIVLAAFLTTAIENWREDEETAAIFVALSALAAWGLMALTGVTA